MQKRPRVLTQEQLQLFETEGYLIVKGSSARRRCQKSKQRLRRSVILPFLATLSRCWMRKLSNR